MNYRPGGYQDTLARLMEAAGYLSLAEVAYFFRITPVQAALLLRLYYKDHPDAAEREAQRLRVKHHLRGSWY